MRTFKCLLVALIGLTALMYALQNILSIEAMSRHIRAQASAATLPESSWAAFTVITVIQLSLGAIALKGAWDLFVARKGTSEQFRTAKITAVWAGGMSLLSWFTLSLMVGAGLFQWGSELGEVALNKSFALGTTSALTILFVWGTTD